MDIHAHRARPQAAITETRNWLKNASGLNPPGGGEIWKLYSRFRKQLPRLAKSLELDPDELTYDDFMQVAYAWVEQAVQSNASLWGEFAS